MSKAREFWIDFKLGPNESTHQNCAVSMNKLGHPYKNEIHVIEKNAYDDMEYNAIVWMNEARDYKAKADALADFINDISKAEPHVIPKNITAQARALIKNYRGTE